LTFCEAVAKTVRKRRTSLGLSRAELGALIGRNHQAIARFENARTTCRLEMLEAMAEAMQTTTIALLLEAETIGM